MKYLIPNRSVLCSLLFTTLLISFGVTPGCSKSGNSVPESSSEQLREYQQMLDKSDAKDDAE